MNKTSKKLSLSRASIRVLAAQSLGGVAGGIPTDRTPTHLCTTDRPGGCETYETTFGCTHDCPTYYKQCR